MNGTAIDLILRNIMDSGNVEVVRNAVECIKESPRALGLVDVLLDFQSEGKEEVPASGVSPMMTSLAFGIVVGATLAIGSNPEHIMRSMLDELENALKEVGVNNLPIDAIPD